MKNKLFIVGAVVALLAISYFLGRCSTKQERDNALNNIIALKDTVHTSSIIIDGLQTSLSEKQAVILSQADAIKAGELEKERLKKLALKTVITNTELTGMVKVLRDSLKLVPGTTIITVKDTSGFHDYIKIPFTLIEDQQKYIHLTAGMNETRTPYYSLSVPFTGNMTVGYKKSGFLKTKPVGIFTTTNPFITISDMDVVIIQQPKRLIDKWWFHAAVGGAAALTIQHFLK